jgi:hypothetical protein
MEGTSTTQGDLGACGWQIPHASNLVVLSRLADEILGQKLWHESFRIKPAYEYGVPFGERWQRERWLAIV